MYLDFVLFLRCDCSHVALFICLLPVSIFVAPKYPVRGIAICLDEGTCGVGMASRGEEGARLRDEYLRRMENFVFFFFLSLSLSLSVFRVSSRPVLRTPRTYARFLLRIPLLRASRPAPEIPRYLRCIKSVNTLMRDGRN